MRPFGGAIKRNYARRRLREYFRLNRDLFPDGHDTLVRLFRAPDDWDHFFSQLDELLSEARRMAKST
ncbi:ribonuclease P protein component [bacterium]|nr:ribonuclease P protein component [bacterium]